MWNGKTFHINKISRFIRTQGEKFVFKRQRKNIYNEPIKGEYDVIEVFGVYHETNSHVTTTTSDGSVVKSQPQPNILCMPDEGTKLKQDDVLEYKGTKYKVVDTSNLLKYDICIDVSLEVIEDGK